MPTIQANNITIAYDIEGAGEPLVLIAGLGYDRWMWHRMIPGLAENFQVISYDNRGVGGSDVPPGPYTAQLLAQDLAGLLQALRVEKTAVLGHSMGGFVAQAFALDYPEMVSKLILSATNFGGPNHVPVSQEALLVLMDTQSDAVTRLRNGIKISTAVGWVENNADFFEEWAAHRTNNPVDPAGYQAQLAVGLSLMSAEACFEGKLKNIQMPTLILFGVEDKVVPLGNAQLLADQIPDSRIKILPGVGHFYPFEDAARAVTAVTDFLL